MAPARLNAAVFAAAAALFACLAASLHNPLSDGLGTLLWVGGVAVPSAALVGALAGRRLAARVTSGAGGLAAGVGVTVAAFVLGVSLVALVAAVRPGGLLGVSDSFGPGAFDVGPRYVLQAACVYGLTGLLLPALPFGAAAGWAFVRLARRARQ